LLFIKDSSEQNHWRSPIPLTRDFLWNFGGTKSSVVDNHHVARCVQIKYDKLNKKMTKAEVSERSERALMKTSILAMNRIPRNGYRHNGYIHY